MSVPAKLASPRFTPRAFPPHTPTGSRPNFTAQGEPSTMTTNMQRISDAEYSAALAAGRSEGRISLRYSYR
jgi:hypothetical protein